MIFLTKEASMPSDSAETTNPSGSDQHDLLAMILDLYARVLSLEAKVADMRPLCVQHIWATSCTEGPPSETVDVMPSSQPLDARSLALTNATPDVPVSESSDSKWASFPGAPSLQTASHET